MEIAKNLVLAGPQSVTVHDTQTITAPDLGNHFYATEAHIGKATRAQAAIPQLKELNQYVDVSEHTGEIDEGFIKNFDLVVFTECYDQDFLCRINKFCRTQEKPIGFIWGGSLGLYGWTFVDFGDKHTIHDPNGEACQSTIITSISNEEEGLVTVSDDKRHGFHDGDYVIFREVQGMEEVNENTYKIEVVSPYSFKIKADTRNFGAYKGEGIAEQVKVPFQVGFQSLEDSLHEPLPEGVRELADPDMDFMRLNKPFELHVILRATLEFFHANKRLPEILDEKDATALSAIADKLVDDLKQRKEKWDKEEEERKAAQDDNTKMAEEGPRMPSLLKVDGLPEGLGRRVGLFARCLLPPSASFWGGIIAQEIVKFTGKFTPIRQWLHYENFTQTLPKDDSSLQRTVDEQSRYRDQIAVFGKEAMTKLQTAKLFMVGAGALGCEYLKQFGLMGVSSEGEGKLIVTDDDTIEVSNLNRQFLFRRNHVGESKCEIACGVAKTINPALNVEALKTRVGSETEDIFTDQFWDDLDGVFGAVDNMKARQYVDEKCVFHKKYLFESGTLGTKCNSQIVVPFKTQSYSDSQDPPEDSIPMCTLRNYPYLIDHTIEWSRDYFHKLFVDGSADLGNFVKDPKGYIANEVKEAGNQAGSLKDKLQFLDKFCMVWPKPDSQNMVSFARQLFQDIFYDQINQLLYCFPADYVDDKGKLFWSSPKRPPHVIEFDSEDDTHLLFIRSVVTILQDIFGIKKDVPTDNELKKLLETATYKVHEPQKKVIKTDDNDQREEVGDEDEKIMKALQDKLSAHTPQPDTTIAPVEFEKDDDSNGHIDFMTAVANLRARNYKINEKPRHEIKLIAGKIIPAIATTTAMIVGACGIELYKYVLGLEVDKFRNAFINLALPLWVFSEPLEPIYNTDKEMDPVLFVPVKAVPPSKIFVNFLRVDQLDEFGCPRKQNPSRDD